MPLLYFMFAVLLTCLSTGAVGGENAPKMEASVSSSGTLELKSGAKKLCDLTIGLFEKDWKQGQATAAEKAPASDNRKFSISAPGGTRVNGEVAFSEEGGAVKAAYKFTPVAMDKLNGVHVSAEFAIQTLTGAKWTADGKSASFPSDYKDMHLFAGEIKSLKIDLANAESLTWSFPEPVHVLLQDNRQWGPSVSVRMHVKGLAKNQTSALNFTLASSSGMNLVIDRPVTITAGPEWIPLNLELDIEPNSALDFSSFGFQDAPAGKHGRVIARNGFFAFEKSPDIPRRFYGVNFCFGAHYLSKEEADRIADRLMRLGYNAIRVHHHEWELVSKQKDSTTLNPEKLDQLDYLLAACAKRGLYITTDLFVSRPVPNKEVGINAPGNVEMDTFKILVPVVPKAWENWKTFSKNLLDHVNPYTKLRYADDPALAWLSMVNEGTFGNFVDRMKKVPEWNQAWNAWLLKRYGSKEKLAEAWKKELQAGEDPAQGSVKLPNNIYAGDPRSTDCKFFIAITERETVEKMKTFLRDELGCKALVTNANAWTNFLSDQSARTVYDYVDDHFYIDHPEFIEQAWRLPSKCPNTSPIAAGAAGGRHTSFTRLMDKPFTITEFNYSAPGRFRGVGGILTGAMGALQGWSGIWRFAYSHNRDSMLQPAPMDYFNMATDPLGQASERASLCLYMRGDMKAAPHSVAIVLTQDEALQPPVPKLAPSWHWMAWVTRVGTQVIDPAAKTPLKLTAALPVGPASAAAAGNSAAALQPYSADSGKLMELLKSRGVVAEDNQTDPAKPLFRSETGEITIDAKRDMMILDTPRTAGGYAPAGQAIETANKGVSITVQDADATVWVSALDDQPIASSKRLLVSHLTDLQNSGIRYAERSRQTLLDWGKLPHLVRQGKAAVTIKHANAGALKVYALSTGGKRIGELKASAANGALSFTADVSENSAQTGARMLYEIVLP